MKNDQDATDGSISVMKRDDSIEPFVLAKLQSCIGNGFYASGEPRERWAVTSRGLAEAVEAYLIKTDPQEPVPSEHIGELVELVLTQTGHTAAGMAIKEHSSLRYRRRRWLKVARPNMRDGRYVQKRWNKSRVVEHFRSEHGLDNPTARMMASRVEQLIFNCGLEVVTTGLVRETARSELLAWGLLPGALIVKRQRPRRGWTRVRDKTDQA